MRNDKQQEIEYRSLADFRYEIRRFLNFSEQAAREAGVEPHQHQALLAIKGLIPKQKATIGVLAERLQVQHHTAVELVDRLERKELIRRSRNGLDKREVILALTRRGERLLADLTLVHRAELRSAGPVLLRALNSVLLQARSSLTNRRRAAGGRNQE
ncbi:MAG TPA: MarR family transcriptional regulator [Candidatus Acidoferrales bacterium]|nr:MarR family transcriptional regulator [Candidatus Acidoferrales bacterium]